VDQSLRFLDSFGFHWQVVEIAREEATQLTMLHSDDANPRGWLYFISRGWTRVIRDYPAEWPGLGWAELEDLCAAAVPLGGDSVVHPPWKLQRVGEVAPING